MEKELAEKKLKIAYVSDAIYPYNKGGKEKRLFDISTRLAAKGHEVTIYCMNWWNGKTKEEMVRVENGVKLKAISPYYPLYSGERRSIKEGVMFGLHSFKMIFEDWDVIDVDHMPYFPLFSLKVVCLLKGKKLTVTWNEVWGLKYWLKYLGKLGYISYLLEKLTYLMPDKIISISEHTTSKLKEAGVKKEIATIPLGIDLDFINSVEPSEEKSDVIYVGRLLEHKHVDVLIEAIAIVKVQKPDIKCFIIGEGPEDKTIRKLILENKLEENVKMFGMVSSQKEVFALLKASKVFVLPSVREGFGLVVLEASACGLPIITTNAIENSASDLVSGEFGFVLELTPENISTGVEYFVKKCVNRLPFKDEYQFKFDMINILISLENCYRS